jgi:hypothetical protein
VTHQPPDTIEAALAEHLDREPLCPCGHAWDRHVRQAGCMAMANDWTETVFCACTASGLEPIAEASRP